jgi:hypothetical protein
LSWQSQSKTEYCPFVIYADFESYLSPIDHAGEGATHAVDEHIPSGFCAYTVSHDERFSSKPFLYLGSDYKNVFFDHLLSEQRRISCILGGNIAMLPLTRDEQAAYDASTICDSCIKSYTDDNWRVRHHNHITGRFIAAVCNSCNLKHKPSKRQRMWKKLMNKSSQYEESTKGLKNKHKEGEDDDDYG